MDSSKSNKIAIAAVLGAGAVLGASAVLGVSGIYMCHKMNRTVSYEIGHLSNKITNLLKEIEDLKLLAAKPKGKTKRNRLHTTASSYFSTGTSSGDDEFYDFSDEDIAHLSGPVALDETDFDALMDQVDTLLDGNSIKNESAYLLLKKNMFKFTDNAEFLWRLAKATHLRGVNFGLEGDNERKKEAAFEAKEFGSQALSLDENNSEVHKWYAITLGSAGDFLSIQERIRDGYTFKEHVDKAVLLAPKDSTLHHMLGRWCYEVFMLTWIERKAASLFGTPPESTADEARNHFFQAEELHPKPWKENKFFIAKTYIGEGDYANAIKWLDNAIEVQITSNEDKGVHEEASSLQIKYQGYRS